MRAYFHLPYRQTEGVIREHASNTLQSIPDYSNISRRINRLDIKISSDNNKSILQHDDYFVIAIDSTGIKISNRDEWIRHKWNIKRGYLKIHVAVDIMKRILSLQVTSEQVHDGKVLSELIEDITIKQKKRVNTVIADGSYDSNRNFQLLSFKGIRSTAIKVRKNSIYRKTNHYLRNKAVQSQKTDLQQWKDSVSYGKRWIVESIFSYIKRMFGREYVTAIRFENMVKEIMLKVLLYNWFQSIAIT